ncbi:MAG TPA: hypothetical protein VNO52_07075 [Methylomirabilota bacterium]|nr:hypothetical protein [Methylomirabilota bacterium]
MPAEPTRPLAKRTPSPVVSDHGSPCHVPRSLETEQGRNPPQGMVTTDVRPPMNCTPTG